MTYTNMSFLEQSWLKNSAWLWLLLPLSWVFKKLIQARRKKLQSEEDRITLSAPVIVVGNISAGGTGKTPVVIALVEELKKRGFKPGVVSRGYGGENKQGPLLVDENTPVTQSGDEAKLIAQLCAVPVVVDAQRDRAYSHLTQDTSINVVISDDGLQHYKLPRHVEIAVVDGQRLFGNSRVFPSGPLREPVERLAEVDFVLLNGLELLADAEKDSAIKLLAKFHDPVLLELTPSVFVNQNSGEKKPFIGAPFNMGNRLQAVTGLGNPERFFGLLEDLPYTVERYPFPDHHRFSKADFERLGLDEYQPIVMTEKDAIKCGGFAKPNFWTLKVELKLPGKFVDDLLKAIESSTPR